MTILISTFYSFEPFLPAMHKYSADKVILIMDKEPKDIVTKALEKVKNTFGAVARIEAVKLDGANLYEIAKTMVDLLEKEEGNKIVNVSGGWKLLAQGVLYGCYARPELVEKIVCNKIEDSTLIELPKLSYNLSSAKRELMEEIVKRNGRSIVQIAEKLGKTRGMLYQHLKELKESGYVDEKFEITLAGRMSLL
ncbi:MAG: CRISPR-associated CARF protein Csa3 [Candidatus ainarchaeum sp.]|nr:CRISPR-associated CARF protein Csa3 [Candidatus ainarchaeum sp.]